MLLFTVAAVATVIAVDFELIMVTYVFLICNIIYAQFDYVSIFPHSANLCLILSAPS